jgi:PadR family transcriptional regulator PadR
LIVSTIEGILGAVPTTELDLLQGTLDVLVLRALSWGPMHGYAVARFIRDGSGGSFRILDGALYTSLHRMEERRWVESDWGTSEKGKRAKFYKLTAAGRRALRAEQLSWDRYVEAVSRVMTATPQPA